MARIVDEAYIEDLCRWINGYYENFEITRARTWYMRRVLSEVKADLENMPEVVLCKDCKHWKCWRISGEGSGDCHLDEGYATLATQHYDFCSYGERKSDAEE